MPTTTMKDEGSDVVVLVSPAEDLSTPLPLSTPFFASCFSLDLAFTEMPCFLFDTSFDFAGGGVVILAFLDGFLSCPDLMWCLGIFR